MNKPSSTLFLIVLLSLKLLFGQNKSDILPLSSYLIEIEKQFNVKFSYADKAVDDIRIKPKKEGAGLEELLTYLEQATDLKFTKLNDRFIIVELPPSEEDQNISLQILDEIFIERFLTRGISESFDGSYKFQPKNYGLLPGMIEPDLFQALLAIPGIQSVDERISNINVRGGTNDENLILFEGIRMYQSGHFFGLISAFNPYLNEEVTLRKNGTLAKYGEGVSSVLAIENSDEIAEQFIGGAGFNFLAADAYINTAITTNLSLQLSGRRSLTDVLTTPTYEAYFQRIFEDSELNNTSRAASIEFADERFHFNDINAKLLWNISEKHLFRANFISIYNNLDYLESIVNEQSSTIDTESSLKQSSLAGSVEYQAKWSDNFSTTAQFYVSSYELDAVSSNLSASQTLNQENVVLDLGLRIDNTYRWTSQWRTNFGYQLSEVGVTNLEDVNQPRFRRSIKEVVLTHSAYADVTYQSKTGSTFFNLGVRNNYIEKLNTFRIEPRLNFSQELVGNVRIEVQGELKSQSLTQIIDLQQDFLGIERRRWQLANGDNIPLVTSQQLGLGLSYNNRGWLAAADIYWKQVEGISSRTQGFQNQFQFVGDIGSYSITGIEVLLNKQFNKLSTWVSYNYSENNYTFDRIFNGEAFPNNLDLTHIINASAVYVGDKLKVGLGLNWNSGRPFTAPSNIQDPGNSVIEFDAPNAERLPEYLRIDASANYSVGFSPKIKGELGLSLWNLSNNTNVVNRFYILDNENSIVEVNNTGLGFTPNFSFRVYF